MNQREKVIETALAQLGYKEQPDGWTKFGQWYADNVAHSQAFARADWCVMFVTWTMRQAGVSGDVWPTTSPQGSATSYCSKWLEDKDYRTAADDMPQPGDIVFFSWSGKADLDHVGLIVAVEGTNADNAILVTCEGNYSNAVRQRRIAYRDYRVIKTFRLPYADTKDDPKPTFPELSFLLKQGSRNQAVELLQAALIAEGYPITGGADGYFGQYTKAALVQYQDDHKLIADGTAGTETFRSLFGH